MSEIAIKKLVLFATTCDDDDSLCTICRSIITELCPKCLQTQFECVLYRKCMNIKCDVAYDVCGNGHTFHLHCTESLVTNDTSSKTCPLCRTPFKLQL